MLELLLAAALAGPQTGSAVIRIPADAGRQRCPDPVVRQAEAGPARAERLGDLPPGRLDLAVWRTENGCTVPATLQQGIGGPAFGEQPRRRRR